MATTSSATHRIPVVSMYPDLGECIKNRLQHGEGLASDLYRSHKLEIEQIPKPQIPFKPTPNMDALHWDISEAQRKLIENAEIAVMDAHISAPIMINTKQALESDQQRLFDKIKWVQNTYAGVDAYYRVLRMLKEQGEPATPKFTATRAGGVMPMALAQYVFGYIISIERKFTTAKELQLKHQYDRDTMFYRRFRPLRVGILGFGDIGQAIGTLFKVAEFQVTGFKRHMPEDGGASLSHCSHKITSDLNEVLSTSDFVISVLPSTKETHYLLNESNLPLCAEKKPVFLNVGRGDVISEDTIVTALDKGWLSQAVLDVFEQEPLSGDSKLWDHPKVHLTPHVAGLSYPEESAEVFVSNLDAYVSGKPLKYKVNWELGY